MRSSGNSNGGYWASEYDIVEKDNMLYLFFKTEDRQPGIKIPVSDKLTGGYKILSNNYVQLIRSFAVHGSDLSFQRRPILLKLVSKYAVVRALIHHVI